MTPFELLLQQQIQQQAQEIAKLYAIVVVLQERLEKWATDQRSIAAQQLVSSENYLDTPWDRSLLVKRRQEVRIP